MTALELKAKILALRCFAESAHVSSMVNAASKELYALTGEVLVRNQFVKVQ